MSRRDALSWREKVAQMIAGGTGVQTIGATLAAKRAEAREAKSVPMLSYPAQLFFGIADGQHPDHTLSGLATYAASSLCYIAMQFRATKLIEAPLWIVDEGEDGEEWLTGGHPLEQVLEQPNPDMTAAEFWHLVSLYLDAPGGGAVVLVKNRDRAGRVASLYPCSRPEFTVEPANGRMFGRFRVQTVDGVREYGPEDVIYYRETDPRSPWGALSPGDAALTDLNLGESQRRAVQAAFRNLIAPGGVVETEQQISDDAFYRLKGEVSEAYSGVQNAGKLMLLDHGLRYKQLEVSLRQTDLGPVMQHVEATVCAAFQVHPILLGLRVSGELNGGLSDSLGPAQDLFYDLCLFPRWQRIAEKVTQGLLREVEPANTRRFIRFDTTRVRALADDLAAKVRTAAAATFWTRAEQRAYTGMDPDVPADAVPVVAEPPVDEEDAKRATPPATKAVSQADITWLLFDAAATAHESSLRLVAADLLREDRDNLVALVEDVRGEKYSISPPSTKETARPLTPEELAAIESAAADYLAGASALAWRRRMGPALRIVAEDAVQRVAASVGVSFDVLQEGLLEVVESRAGLLIRSVSETTRDAVRRALRDGLAAGESIPDMARRIADAAAFSQERATLVARTESTAMTNLTQREQLEAYARRSGRKITKTWMTARDARVRDEHRALEGETRGIDEAFSNGEMQPGAPRCRCSLYYTAEEAA